MTTEQLAEARRLLDFHASEESEVNLSHFTVRVNRDGTVEIAAELTDEFDETTTSGCVAPHQ